MSQENKMKWKVGMRRGKEEDLSLTWVFPRNNRNSDHVWSLRKISPADFDPAFSS